MNLRPRFFPSWNLKKSATVSDITFAIRLDHNIMYSTVASTLSRLFKKSLIERKTLPGPGGTKYLYSPGKNEDVKRRIIEASLDRLFRAFGPDTFEEIYLKLHSAGSITAQNDDTKPRATRISVG